MTRVGATLDGDALDGMSYQFLDWHMKEIGAGKITDGKLTIPNNLPIWVIKLNR